MKRIDIILQARSGSTRLPGKIFKPILNRAMLDWILDRLARVKGTRLCVATTQKDFHRVKKIADKHGALTIWGSEDDVLSRFLKAAKTLDSEVIVRTTADNPLVDFKSLDRAIRIFNQSACDHLVCEGLPYGSGFEVISRKALEKAGELAGSGEREHVTTVILRNPSLFKLKCVKAERAVHCPGLRLTVDTPADLSYMRNLYKKYFAPKKGFVELSEVVKHECP